MKEQPLFAPGQEIVCVDSSPSKKNPGVDVGLIEGNKYTVTSIPKCACGQTGVCVGVPETVYKTLRCKCGRRHKVQSERQYSQYRFVPASFDRYAEETFHQSLKGKPVNA